MPSRSTTKCLGFGDGLLKRDRFSRNVFRGIIGADVVKLLQLADDPVPFHDREQNGFAPLLRIHHITGIQCDHSPFPIGASFCIFLADKATENPYSQFHVEAPGFFNAKAQRFYDISHSGFLRLCVSFVRDRCVMRFS